MKAKPDSRMLLLAYGRRLGPSPLFLCDNDLQSPRRSLAKRGIGPDIDKEETALEVLFDAPTDRCEILGEPGEN